MSSESLVNSERHSVSAMEEVELDGRENQGLRSRRPDGKVTKEELDRVLCEEEKASFGWRDAMESLNQAMDALFGYNLGNVLKIVNICVVLIIGLNAMMLHSELVKSEFRWTLMPSVIAGFLILASVFVFLLNV